MASITTVTVTVKGTVAPDITDVVIDGAIAVIAADRTWSWTGVVPAGEQKVMVTSIGPTRAETRAIRLVAGPAPVVG